MNVNHELVHSYIAALSCTKEGAELVQALEAVRYYHSNGRTAELGNGSVLVTAIDAYDGIVMGIVLLPGKKDKLTYQSADWCDNTIKGALFWKYYHSYPVVIPYVLAEWAAECIIERSEHEPVSIRYTKPVLHSVDTIPHMYVRLPWGLKLPGLTVDKLAKRKAVKSEGYVAENSYIKHFAFQDPLVKGYEYDAHVLYGASGGEISYALDVVDTLDADSIDTILAGNHIFTVMPEAWRAICQLKSNFKHWKYFDECTLHQCVKHIIENNFTPEDI